MQVTQNYEGIDLQKLQIIVEASQKKYVNTNEGALLYLVGRNVFRNLGERAGARRKIGGKLIYNVELINQYIEREYGQ